MNAGPTLGRGRVRPGAQVLFVDDLGMPNPEVSGAQPPLELLRQAVSQGGWYTGENEFKTLQNVSYVAAMTLSTGTTANVPRRLLRRYHIISIPPTPAESLRSIFGALLSNSLSPLLQEMSRPIASATVDLFGGLQTSLLPTPTRAHYTFNLRDLRRLVRARFEDMTVAG